MVTLECAIEILILTYREVKKSLTSKKLGKVKCSKENDFFDRQNNIINHVLMHKCSRYCLREVKLSEIFDPLKHKDDDVARFINSNGTLMINIIHDKFRINFGTAKRI